MVRLGSDNPAFSPSRHDPLQRSHCHENDRKIIQHASRPITTELTNHVANMTSSRQPETFLPVRKFTARRKLPDHLYVVVENVAPATFEHQDCSVVPPVMENLCAKLPFTCQDLRQIALRTHLAHRNYSTSEAKFISVFESKGTHLPCTVLVIETILTKMQRPHCEHVPSVHQYPPEMKAELLVQQSTLWTLRNCRQVGLILTPDMFQSGSSVVICQ
jgi:hypothetical protein